MNDLHLADRVIKAVAAYWTADVRILGVWQDGPAACVVHQRTCDPDRVLGHRFEFTADCADGTIEGYARDAAITLAEPLGTQVFRTRQDRHGILWVAIPEGQPTPEPPQEYWTS